MKAAMKLQQLRYVRAVADLRSFSRAAEICNATQPTLSNSISQLEEELGGALFTRTTRNVELTPFGSYLMPFLRAVLDSRDELEKAALAYHNPVHKLLRIGFSPLVDAKLLDRVLKPYQQSHPDVSIFFKECLLDELAQRLANNTIDLLIAPHVDGEDMLHHRQFYRDELCYLPQGNAPDLALAHPLQIGNLPDAPVIMTGGGCGLNGLLKSLFEQQGARLRAYSGQAISYQAIEEWSALGIGAGILPARKLSVDRNRALPLHGNDGRPALVTYDWRWNGDDSRQSHLADLIDYIDKIVPALTEGEAGGKGMGTVA